MLRLYINGKEASLSNDSEVSVIINSTLLDQSNDDATYPFTLPLDANRHIFAFSERPGVVFNNEYSATLFFGANEVLVGYGYVSEISSKSVEFFIKTSGKSFMGMYGNRYLDSLSDLLGYYSNYGTNFITQVARDSYLGTLPFVFAPISDPNRGSEPVNGTRRGQINPFDYATGTIYTAAEKVYPFLYIHAFIERLFETAGYVITNDDSLSITGFSKVYMICLKDENGYTPSFMGNYSYVKMLPHVTLYEFFEELQRKFNLRFVFDDNRRTVAIRSSATLFTNETVDLTGLLSDSLKKVFDEPTGQPENRRFFDKAIDIAEGADSYDPTLATLSEYMEYNTADVVTDDMQTDDVSCLSRTVVTSETVIMMGVPLEYKPVLINSLKYVSSDLIFSIFKPLDPTMTMMRYSDFLLDLVNVGEDFDINDYSQYYRFPESTNILVGGLSLLWSDYSSSPGLYTLLWEEYYNLVDNLFETHELDLVPSPLIIGDVYKLLSLNVIISGCRYLVKKIEMVLTADSLKSCLLQLSRI